MMTLLALLAVWVAFCLGRTVGTYEGIRLGAVHATQTVVVERWGKEVYL